MTCCTTLIGDYYGGRARDRYLALQTVCATISATAFFILGGAMGTSGWRAPFQLYAVGLLLAPSMAAFLSRPRPGAPVDEALTVGHRRSSAGRLAGICLLTPVPSPSTALSYLSVSLPPGESCAGLRAPHLLHRYGRPDRF